MEDKEYKIKLSERLGYGLGGFRSGMAIGALSTYLLMYMTNVAFLDIAVISTILAVSRIFDGITDIVAGTIIDQTNSKYGKSRIWIGRMALPLTAAMFLLYLVPQNWPEFTKYVYVFIVYNLTSAVFFTFIAISHLSLPILMTPQSAEHGRLIGLSSFFSGVASMLLNAFFVRLLMVFSDQADNPNTQRAYSCAMAICCVAVLLVSLAQFFFTRERVTESIRKSNPISGMKKKEVLANLKALFKGKYFLLILFAEGLNFFGNAMLSSSMSYYTMYVLQDFGAMTKINLAMGICNVVVAFALGVIPIKKHRTKLYALSLLFLAGGSLSVSFIGHHPVLILFSMIAVGIGKGGFTCFSLALIAECITYYEKTTGRLLVGLANAIKNSLMKFGLGISTAVYGAIIAASGFNAALEVQPDSAIRSFTTTFSIVPAICHGIVAIVFILFFDLEKKMAELPEK